MKYFPLLFAPLSFAVAYGGGIVAARFAREGRSWLNFGLGFGGGFLLAVALVDIIPEAAEQAKGAHIAVAVGFAIFFLIEQLFDAHFCPAGEVRCGKDHSSTGFLAVVGMGLHGLIDGIAVASALLTDVRLAMLVSVAVLVHKVPDGFCLGTLLCAKGYTDRSTRRQLLIFSFTTPIGILVSYYALVGTALNPGVALGLSAGSFVYIATSHLLPEARLGAAGTGQLVLSVLAGIVAAVMLPGA